MKKHKLIVLGGTFDRLHKGHEYFISEAESCSEKMIIGLTSDKYAKDKISLKNLIIKSKITSFVERKKELEIFLSKKGYLAKTRIIKIDNVYGNTLKRKNIEAIAVTAHSKDGAIEINKKRKKLGMQPLSIKKINLLVDQDKKTIASSRVRLGHIDRTGLVFSKLSLWGQSIFENLRLELKKPIGELIIGDPQNITFLAKRIKKLVDKANPSLFITVGDQVTKMSNHIGISANISIFDYKVNRNIIYSSISDLGFTSEDKIYKTVKNPPKHVTYSLIKAITQALKRLKNDNNKILIRVIGEDDLAALPLILLSPLDSVVIYGQPGEGVVYVPVTEEKKKEIMELILSNS